MLHTKGPFFKVFKVVALIVYGDILRSVTLMLGVNKLLIMAKDTKSLYLIIISKVFSQFINCSNVI